MLLVSFQAGGSTLSGYTFSYVIPVLPAVMDVGSYLMGA